MGLLLLQHRLSLLLVVFLLEHFRRWVDSIPILWSLISVMMCAFYLPSSIIWWNYSIVTVLDHSMMNYLLFQGKCWFLTISWPWRGAQQVTKWCWCPTTLKHWISLKSFADLEGNEEICDQLSVALICHHNIYNIRYSIEKQNNQTNKKFTCLLQIPLCSTGWHNVN